MWIIEDFLMTEGYIYKKFLDNLYLVYYYDNAGTCKRMLCSMIIFSPALEILTGTATHTSIQL